VRATARTSNIESPGRASLFLFRAPSEDSNLCGRRPAQAIRRLKMNNGGGWGSIVECLISDKIEESGIGYVTVLTDNGGNYQRYVNFLVDCFCLGVKNLDFHKISPSDYPNIIESLTSATPMIKITPAHAKKFIEGALLYSSHLGFKPHPDFQKYFKCLADVDSSECLIEFTYGQNGKPLYVQGPRESFQQAQRIVKRLANKLGEDKFDYILAM
jgi:hypothetical protein